MQIPYRGQKPPLNRTACHHFFLDSAKLTASHLALPGEIEFLSFVNLIPLLRDNPLARPSGPVRWIFVRLRAFALTGRKPRAQMPLQASKIGSSR